MKGNHESFLDKTAINDNEFSSTTTKEPPAELKVRAPRPKLPKRKLELTNRYQAVYLFHGISLLVMLVVSMATMNVPLLLATLPYAGLIYFMHRIGGSLSKQGMDTLLWNLAVLVSTYSNARTPNLRKHASVLQMAGAGLLLASSLVSGWLMLIGGVALATGLVYAFAEKDSDTLAGMGRIVSLGLLVTGTLTLFYSPGHGLLVLTLSLCFHRLFEQWDGYEFDLHQET